MVQYPNVGAANIELFGDRTAAAITDLPCRISYLVAGLPQGTSLTSDSLIDNSTLLRFYSPFLPPDRLQRIREGMKGAGGATIHEIAGISASTIRDPDWLRFCPQCVKGDRERFGQCYWHRSHQVPGVLVCPEHKMFLENSSTRIRRRINKVDYIRAEDSVLSILPRPIIITDSSHEFLDRLARDVVWLLAREHIPIGLDIMRQCFVTLLISHDLASRDGLIKRKVLIKALREIYSPALLELLQCNFDEEKSGSWPALIVSHLRKATFNHPLRYLLLIHLLGQTAESFFDICTSTVTNTHRMSEPLGRGPWPCLNVTCVNHRKLVIDTYQLKPLQSVAYRTSGIFSCPCGFSYLKQWPGRSSENKYCYSRVENYGHVWETRLRKLWPDPSISLRNMVELLGADRDVIRKQAAVLGLSASRIGPRNRKTLIGAISKSIKKERRAKASKFAKELKARRREFLRVRRDHPTAPRSELRDIAARVYVWLYRYDKKWLKDHLPPLRERVPRIRRPIYWEDRDVMLEKKVLLAASTLREIDGRPIRVTVGTIIQYIDKHLQQSSTEIRLINSKRFLDRVPLTAKVLNEVTETILEYWRRKLDWASAHFSKDDRCPSRWQLMEYAGISRKGMTEPLAALVEETLSSLRKATTIISYRAA